MCAHAVRVALKNINGVEDVNVSLSKGEAVATLTPANNVRYEQLLRAIEKNGFVVKGSKVVADGVMVSNGGALELQISGSNQRLKLEPANSSVASTAPLTSKQVEVIGLVPEVSKGRNPEVIRYESIAAK